MVLISRHRSINKLFPLELTDFLSIRIVFPIDRCQTTIISLLYICVIILNFILELVGNVKK